MYHCTKLRGYKNEFQYISLEKKKNESYFM